MAQPVSGACKSCGVPARASCGIERRLEVGVDLQKQKSVIGFERIRVSVNLSSPMAGKAMARALQLRPQRTVFRNPSSLHFFSSSTSDPNGGTENSSTDASSPPSQSQSSFASYFSDVKSSLKQRAPAQQRQQPRKPFSFSSSSAPETPHSKVFSLEEIRKNLSEFRRRSAVPPPQDQQASSPSHSSQHVSFQELYKRNVISKGGDSGNEASKGGNLSFEAIRESLRQLRSTAEKNQTDRGAKINDSMSLSKIRESLRPNYPNLKGSPVVIGGTENLPSSVFGREMEGNKEGKSPAMTTDFLKMYSYGELGEKLRKLRPETKKGDNWFSFTELNERLVKLREIEEKETKTRIGGVFNDLRVSLSKLQMSNDEKARKTSIQRLDVLGQIGGTPTFVLAPPKEHLVEKYFHPDNMSSLEKLKLELKKVRDEFKMSESDCGSARVQVAQLTTRIKHLAAVLHKKDKHSRKGLQEMVQKRKKLLKYLRRTDWDSYCLVLSKLGLRDNPDYKN